MPEKRGKVAGLHDRHNVMFYGLSTCVWCKRTRKLLEEHDVAFEFVYVDLLEGDEVTAGTNEAGGTTPTPSCCRRSGATVARNQERRRCPRCQTLSHGNCVDTERQSRGCVPQSPLVWNVFSSAVRRRCCGRSSESRRRREEVKSRRTESSFLAL